MRILPRYLDTGFENYILDANPFISSIVGADNIYTVTVETFEGYCEMIDTAWSIEKGGWILPSSYPIHKDDSFTKTLEYWNKLILNDRLLALKYFIEQGNSDICIFLIEEFTNTCCTSNPSCHE